MPLMEALRHRESHREFSPEPLDEQNLSDLLWAAAGINRPKLGGRTTPSAMNAQEVQLYVALPQGLFRYEPEVCMNCSWQWPVTCAAPRAIRISSTTLRWTSFTLPTTRR
jgi:hypothetical protein